MENIREFKISLMQKDKENKINEEGKESFIVKTSATFNLEKYL